MSFKDELDKRRKANAEEHAKREADRKQSLAAIEARAKELEGHLSEQDVASVALQLERNEARIVLKHSKYQIVIDPNVNEYLISMQVPAKKAPFNLMTVESRRAANLEQVDQHILDIVQAQEER
ncbi:MAG: hypothetical protein ABSC37_04305 [Xanthobacteraceae bacterium]